MFWPNFGVVHSTFPIGEKKFFDQRHTTAAGTWRKLAKGGRVTLLPSLLTFSFRTIQKWLCFDLWRWLRRMTNMPIVCWFRLQLMAETVAKDDVEDETSWYTSWYNYIPPKMNLSSRTRGMTTCRFSINPIFVRTSWNYISWAMCSHHHVKQASVLRSLIFMPFRGNAWWACTHCMPNDL